MSPCLWMDPGQMFGNVLVHSQSEASLRPCPPSQLALLFITCMWFLLAEEIHPGRNKFLMKSQRAAFVAASGHNDSALSPNRIKPHRHSIRCSVFLQLAKNLQTVGCLTFSAMRSVTGSPAASSGFHYTFMSFMIHCYISSTNETVVWASDMCPFPSSAQCWRISVASSAFAKLSWA